MIATARRFLRSERPLSLLDGVLAFCMWLVSYVIYFRTLFPYPLVGDSAEFEVLAKQLGVTHNPGYPIYILLAHIWTYLPAGDIAYRVNLFSAFMAANAVAGVYVATVLLSRERIAGIVAALAFAVSWTFWSQAVIAEVYTSGAAMLSIILACIFGWYQTDARWPLFVAGMCGALSLGVHSTTSLLAPAIVVFLLLAWRGRSNPWLHATTGVVAGLIVYFIVFVLVDWNAPAASMFNASYTPGASTYDRTFADFDSVWARVWFNASAGQWRGAMYSSWGEVPRRIMEYRMYFGREFAVPTIALIVLGFALMCWRAPAAAVLVALGLALQWSFAFTYRIGDYYVFYITGYLLMAVMAGYAVGVVVRWLAKHAGRGALVVRVGMLALLLVVCVWPTLRPRWPDVVASRVPFLNAPGYPARTDTVAEYIIITRTVGMLPANAIVFVDWNQLYTFWYAASVAGTRPDLRFIEPYTNFRRDWLADSNVEFIRQNIQHHPIFFQNPVSSLLTRGFRYNRVDVGGAEMYQVVPD